MNIQKLGRRSSIIALIVIGFLLLLGGTGYYVSNSLGKRYQERLTNANMAWMEANLRLLNAAMWMNRPTSQQHKKLKEELARFSKTAKTADATMAEIEKEARAKLSKNQYTRLAQNASSLRKSAKDTEGSLKALVEGFSERVDQ